MQVSCEGSSGTVIQGNLIGTDATGMTNLANGSGVFVDFSADNTIGGTATGARNVISGNPGGNHYLRRPRDGKRHSGELHRYRRFRPVGLEVGRAMQILRRPGKYGWRHRPRRRKSHRGNGNGILIEEPNASGNIVRKLHRGGCHRLDPSRERWSGRPP